jgi:hypothetical protein
MERMRTIPVDLILHETALKLRELPEEHHRGLADAIDTYAVDHRAVADQWDSGSGRGAGVCQSARWLITNRLDAQAFAPGHVSTETRAMEVAVARRLADCALSLLVTQDAEDAATAQTLLQAAQRVVGLARAKPGAEAVLFTSTTNSDDDGLSPATLRHYLAATRDALGLGSGPVFLGDIVTRAKSLADANEAERGLLPRLLAALNLNLCTSESEALATAAKLASGAVYLDRLRDSDGQLAAAIKREQDAIRKAEVENANKASIIAKQEKFIVNLKSAALVGVAGVIADALHLEAKPGDSDPSTLSRRCVEAIEHLQATVDARAEERDVATRERLKVARDCLPDGVDIIACLRDDKPTTYKASNTGEEYDTPEAAARAAWEHHMRPSQSVPDRAFKVGDQVRFARVHPKSVADGRPPLGWTGIIMSDDGSTNFRFKVAGTNYDGDEGNPYWWFATESLDLVTPTA